MGADSPLPALSVDEELELLLVEEEEVVVVELQEEDDEDEEEVAAPMPVAEVVHVDAVVVEAGGTRPSMSAALCECDRQSALMGSKPSCRRKKSCF